MAGEASRGMAIVQLRAVDAFKVQPPTEIRTRTETRPIRMAKIFQFRSPVCVVRNPLAAAWVAFTKPVLMVSKPKLLDCRSSNRGKRPRRYRRAAFATTRQPGR